DVLPRGRRAAAEPLRDPGRRRRRRPDADRRRARPGDEAEAEARHLRRARGRAEVGRLLPRAGTRLRQLLAVPRPARALGRRARRLARSSLTQRATDRLQVVHDVGGIHAQVQASAELQLAARVDGITRQDVRDALWRDRTLVKAWTLRGTLHLHPADEAALWLAARRALLSEPTELVAWSDPKGVVHPPVGADELVEIQAAVGDGFGGRALRRVGLG